MTLTTYYENLENGINLFGTSFVKITRYINNYLGFEEFNKINNGFWSKYKDFGSNKESYWNFLNFDKDKETVEKEINTMRHQLRNMFIDCLNEDDVLKIEEIKTNTKYECVYNKIKLMIKESEYIELKKTYIELVKKTKLSLIKDIIDIDVTKEFVENFSINDIHKDNLQKTQCVIFLFSEFKKLLARAGLQDVYTNFNAFIGGCAEYSLYAFLKACNNDYTDNQYGNKKGENFFNTFKNKVRCFHNEKLKQIGKYLI